MAKNDQFAGRNIRTLPPELAGIIPSGRVPGAMETYDQFPSIEPGSPISGPNFFTEVRGKLGQAGRAMKSEKARDALKRIGAGRNRTREFYESPSGLGSPEMDISEIARILREMRGY